MTNTDPHAGRADNELSTLRLWLMRVPYALTGILFGATTWTTLIEYHGQFEAMEGIAYSYWGALSILALFGLRYPIKMLPLLLLQFLYKAIWVLFVGYPLWSQGQLDANGVDLMRASLIGIAVDLIAIPWPYVYRGFVLSLFKK